MKLGIITDVHSNIQALNIVLKEFDKVKVDKIICCGDVIGIGANPEETVQALIQRKNMLIAVKGNHEQYLLEGLPKNIHDDKRTMNLEEIKNHEWTHNKLSKESKKFISELQLSNTIQIENKKIYIVHYPSNQNGMYKKHIKKPTINQNKEMFREIDADIFIYGHTHTISVNKERDKWYINPGSLGCPEKSNIANAGMLSIDGDNIDFKQLNVEYDVNSTIKEIEKMKMPFYKEILKIFYGKEQNLMKFIIITGPQAVGKMTVGQELIKITNLKLLHNHITIEVLTKIFDYSRDSFRKLNEEFRMQIFREFTKSNQEGIIFTTTWDFNDKEEWKRIYNYIQIFKENKAQVYIVELEADLNERLRRNKTENRLENKASKRNLEWSEKDLLKSVEKYRFNSKENEIREENYIRIDNTNLEADIVARMIKEKFKL